MADCTEAETAAGHSQSGDPYTSVRELGEGERLVLWAFRRWVSGPEHLPMLAREFDRQFRRSDARPALVALDAALSVLCRQARRTIVYHQPCCPCLGADETCFLAVVAALQAGAAAEARARAPWLVRGEGVEAFLRPLDDFAECLSAAGHDLPWRPAPRATTAASRLAPWVH